MKGLFTLAGAVVVTLAGLLIFTEYDGGRSLSMLAGYPLVSIGESAVGMIAIGGTGFGVLVIAFAGVGGFTLTFAGAGILFGTGQISAGLFAMGQVGVGVIMYLGQGGLGLNFAGQAGLAYRLWMQDNDRSESYFRELVAELLELCALPFQRNWEKRAEEL